MLRGSKDMAWFGNGLTRLKSESTGVRFATPLTHTATAVTIAGALVPVEQLTAPRCAVVVAVGLVFGVLGTWGVALVEQRTTRASFAQYFALMSGLAAVIVVASEGYATIATMPLLSQAVLFGSVWHGLVGTSALLGLLALTLYDTTTPERLWVTLLSFGGAIAFVMIFSVVYRREALWRAQSEQLRDELAATNIKLRLHAEQIEELAATKERTRMARELHDGLGHYLTAIHVQLEAARALVHKSQDNATKAIARAQTLARQGLTDVRESVSLLREGSHPVEHSLSEILGEIVTSWSADSQPVEFFVNGDIPNVTEATQHALRRVLQEALSNVRHHAQASRTMVTLSAVDACVQLDVEDDGQGAVFDPPRADEARHFGLRSARERVAAVGGEVTFGNNAGKGFRVQVRVPQ